MLLRLPNLSRKRVYDQLFVHANVARRLSVDTIEHVGMILFPPTADAIAWSISARHFQYHDIEQIDMAGSPISCSAFPAPMIRGELAGSFRGYGIGTRNINGREDRHFLISAIRVVIIAERFTRDLLSVHKIRMSAVPFIIGTGLLDPV